MSKLFDEEYLEKYEQEYGIPTSHPLYPLYLEYQGRPKYRRKWEILRRKELVDQLSKLTNLKNTLILDCGCGIGWASAELTKAGAMCVGIDIEQEYLHFAKARAQHERIDLHLLVADGSRLPFVSEAFDLIICIDVLDHVPSPSEFLTEVSRVLREYGTLFFTTPNKLWPWDPHTFPKPLLVTHWLPSSLAQRYVRWRGYVTPQYYTSLLTYRRVRDLFKTSDLIFDIKIPEVQNLAKRYILSFLKKLGVLMWILPTYRITCRKKHFRTSGMSFSAT